MSEPAPYNLDTLARIKAMAGGSVDSLIAARLGWTTQRLRNVAKRHAIDLTLSLSERDNDFIRNHDPNVQRWRDAEWNVAKAEIRRAGIAVKLGGFDVLVFDAIFRAAMADAGARICSREIAEHAGIKPEAVKATKDPINSRIIPIGLAIAGLKGGGYRLVDLLSEKGEQS
jgi:hypothetical protein